MSDKNAIHFTVSGRVQGVFFRASTEARARQLGLTGWVRNMQDGRVEGVAVGTANDIESFIEWLKQGPRMARVDEVEINSAPDETFHGFQVRYE